MPRTRALAFYLFVPLAFGWFGFVAMSAAVELRPTSVRFPTPSGYDPYMDDFTVFYSAGNLVRSGHGDDVYRLDSIRSSEAATLGTAPENILVLPFFTPPFALLPVAVTSLLSLRVAAAVWTLGGLATLVASAVAVRRSRGSGLNWRIGMVWAIGIASSPPFFQTLLHGQTTFFLVGGFTLLWFGGFQRRGDWMTVSALVLIAQKPQLVVVPAAYLLLTGQARSVVRALGITGALTLGTLGITGWQLIPDYVRLMLHATTWDARNGISTWGMFGWNAFSRALLGTSRVPRFALTAILDLGTALALWRTMRRPAVADNPERVFTLLVLGSLLLSPHVYEHDVLLAALPVFLLATERSISGGRLWTPYAGLGWMVLYFHFDVLTATSVNLTTLWLASGMLAAAGIPRTISAAFPRWASARESGLRAHMKVGNA